MISTECFKDVPMLWFKMEPLFDGIGTNKPLNSTKNCHNVWISTAYWSRKGITEVSLTD